MPVTGDAPLTPSPRDAADCPPRDPDGPLDRLARLARRMFGVDMAAIACTDADGAWQAVAGRAGAPVQCAWSIEHPIRAADGRLLGAFRLWHGQAREFTGDDRQALQDLSSLAATAVEKRHALACERADEDTWRDEARKLSLAIAGSGTGVWDRNVVTGEITYSPGWKALLGYGEHELTTRIEDAYTRLHLAVAEWLAAHDLPETVTFCCFGADDAELYRARLGAASAG